MERPVGLGLILYPGTAREFSPKGSYSSSNLLLLEKLGYLTIQHYPFGGNCIALTPQAFDYYKYSHHPILWQKALDFWEKTEKYWLSLLVGGIGGLLSDPLRKSIARLFNWLGSLLR